MSEVTCYVFNTHWNTIIPLDDGPVPKAPYIVKSSILYHPGGSPDFSVLEPFLSTESKERT